MRQKLTNEGIDKRLIESDRKIVRIDNYPGKNSIKIKWKCLVDGHIWYCSTANIFNKKGCPKCAGNLPLSNNEIDSRLVDRNIKRISDYPGKNSIKIKWKCLVDGHTWDATTNDICSGRGCPKCAGNMKLTNCEIDNRLKDRNIIRLSDYPGKNNVKMKWRCLVDGNEWESTPSNLFHPKYPTGCPICSSKQYSNEKIDNIINKFFIKRESEYINSKNKMSFKCLKCNNLFNMNLTELNKKIEKSKCLCKSCEKREYINKCEMKIDKILSHTKIKRIGNFVGWGNKMEFVDDCGYSWKTTPSYIIRSKGSRNQRPRLTNNIIDSRLIHRNIKRLGNYVDKDTPIEFKCSITGDVWKCLPNNIFRGYGNPKLNINIHKREKDIFNYLIEKSVDFNYHKKIEDSYRKYYVDFYIQKINTIIEYNGKQHYESIKYFGGECAFKRQQERDSALRKYCNDNNIKLFEISYKLSWQSILDTLNTIIEGK